MNETSSKSLETTTFIMSRSTIIEDNSFSSNSSLALLSSLSSSTSSSYESPSEELLLYIILECVVAVAAFIGNLLVITVFIQDKRLRKRTNFYIVSLAVADCLVGCIGIPSAILTRMGIPYNAFAGCLMMLSLLIVLCTTSILNLVAVSLDRYWAILYPLNYHQNMTSRAAGCLLLSCWVIGAFVGFLPLFGWNNGPAPDRNCLFIPIMSYDFLVFLYFVTIVVPAILMAFFYAKIYYVVTGQARTISVMSWKGDRKTSTNGLQRSATFPMPLLRYNSEKRHPVQRQQTTTGTEETDSREDESPEASTSGRNGMSSQNDSSGGHDSMRVSYCRREVKKAKKLSIIVFFFMVCWMPLYTLNFLESFQWVQHPVWLLDTLIILSHLNSAVNPLLYAYHMKDFREAFRRLLCLCILRPEDLRDIRRRELATITQSYNQTIRNQNHITSSHHLTSNSSRRSKDVLSVSYPNSQIPTPEISFTG